MHHQIEVALEENEYDYYPTMQLVTAYARQNLLCPV